MALVGCLKDEQSLSQYLACVGELEEWFDRSFLDLNVDKTEEMAFGRAYEGRDGTTPLSPPLQIKGQQVQRAAVFRYLGTVIDGKLSFSDHVNQVYKRPSNGCTSEETSQLRRQLWGAGDCVQVSC
ncbi:hypothetical protein C0Q70_01679 [Pomacea canaliculata]|uniref:Reverse transcriptase domain-containing protein n=1 Tax=Pomacea canaliculata TaxID=400727 RepID=A0A2T7Q057_POMCA|nr:hypothetical protein C0Q70_01679 [Pomacea canaliculata]